MAKRSSSLTPLETISNNGTPPQSRLTDSMYAYEIVRDLIEANERRARTDAKVYGLVSGFPPFSAAELRKQAQAWRSNVNWRIAEAFLNTALTAYWDVIAEAPSYASITVESSDPDKQQEWSEIATEEFDKLNRRDTSLNFMFRRNHHDMVLYRCGPSVFEDAFSFKARPIECGKLLVPDRTPSCVNEWSMAVVRAEYRVDELYGYIRNPKAATAAGWDVAAARQALMHAAPASLWPANRRYDWEWYAQRIRNNDYYYSNCSESIPCAHLYFREFPQDGEAIGRITKCVVWEQNQIKSFLFRRERQFENWRQIVHPFYYDTGDGTHHSVKGLGIKAYGALETLNRMICHGVDAAVWSSSMHFQATTPNAMNNLAVTTMGPYIWHSPDGTFIQQQMGQQLEGLMAVKQDVLNTVTSNLAQYRQGLQEKQGNPITAREVAYRAANQGVIGRSGMTWYFEQLDDYWQERHRRVMNPHLSMTHADYAEAMRYRERCIKRGVSEAALRTAEVRATRTVGYGSADDRMQSMTRLLSRISLYDENGRQKILEDITAMDVGPALMRRYMPQNTPSREDQEQAAEAQQSVAVMKTGIEPMVTPSQNPVIYASVYMAAASAAMSSLEQGANPLDVHAFVSIAGSAIAKQLERFKNDPSRREIYDALFAQWKQLAQLQDQLAQKIQQEQAAAQQQQAATKQRQQQVMSEMDLDRMKAEHDEMMKERKTNFMISDKARKTDANLVSKQMTDAQSRALKDATAASDIRRKNAQAESPETE